MTPELDPDHLRDLEARMRRQLHEEADALTPGDRLTAIRRETQGRGSRSPGWLWPLASAAAVAVLAIGGWATFLRGPVSPPVVGAPTSATSALSPTSPTSAGPTASPTSAPTTPPPTNRTTPAPTGSTTPSATTSVPPNSPPPTAVVTGTVPAFFVEPVSGGGVGLVRDFVPVPSAPALGTVEAAQLAARLSMTGSPQHAVGAPVVAWDPATTVAVTLRTEAIDVVLSRAGRPGLPAESQRLAVQQLVWAVTAGLQQVRPVSVSVASGGSLFATMPAGVYQRPAPDQAYRDVAPVWVDSPAAGAAVSAATGLTVRGQACTFEGTVSWVVERDGRAVRQGSTTATSGCPVQGSWSVTLPPLPAGSYVFHARELSANDGSVRGDQVVRFTSR